LLTILRWNEQRSIRLCDSLPRCFHS
jgi:hypothetical protein